MVLGRIYTSLTLKGLTKEIRKDLSRKFNPRFQLFVARPARVYRTIRFTYR